jgi:hypothetical protein
LYGKQGVKSQSQAHHAKNVEKHCLWIFSLLMKLFTDDKNFIELK